MAGPSHRPKRARNPISPAGHVYLGRTGGVHKIGISSNIERRLRELRFDELVCAVHVQDARNLERELHKAFRHRRLPQSEYFFLKPEEVSQATAAMKARSGTEANAAKSQGSTDNSRSWRLLVTWTVVAVAVVGAVLGCNNVEQVRETSTVLFGILVALAFLSVPGVAVCVAFDLVFRRRRTQG